MEFWKFGQIKHSSRAHFYLVSFPDCSKVIVGASESKSNSLPGNEMVTHPWQCSCELIKSVETFTGVILFSVFNESIPTE